MNDAFIQTVISVVGGIVSFLYGLYKIREQNRPGRITTRVNAPAVAFSGGVANVVVDTNASLASTVQRLVFDQNATNQRLVDMEKKLQKSLDEINTLKKENVTLKREGKSKDEKITQLEQRVTELENELRKHNIDVPGQNP